MPYHKVHDAALEAQVAALTERLEQSPPPLVDAGAFWALEELKRRVPEGPGAVLYTGTVQLPGNERYDWQIGYGTEDLLEDDWSTHSGTLAALAHPVRLRLLREILGGRHATAELGEIEGLGTSGQLYHHLRQLVSAGWLRVTGRGHYAVPPERVIPLLVTLAAARR
jgi:hypothetical protein